MVQAIKCRRMNMNSSIINGSEVSRLPVAIQTAVARRLQIGVSVRHTLKPISYLEIQLLSGVSGATSSEQKFLYI